MLALPYGMREKKTQVGQLPGRLGGFGTSKKHLQKEKTCDLPVFYSILVGSFPASIFFFWGGACYKSQDATPRLWLKQELVAKLEAKASDILDQQQYAMVREAACGSC